MGNVRVLATRQLALESAVIEKDFRMDWYFVCLAPKKAFKIKAFPCSVGRSPNGISSVKFDDPSMSRVQFSLNSLMGWIYYVNKSRNNPAEVDGTVVSGKVRLTPGVHIVKVGNTTIGIGTDYDELCTAVSAQTVKYYMARVGGCVLGPWTGDQLVQACENGVLGRDSTVWYVHDPKTVHAVSEIVDFGPDSATVAAETRISERRFVTVDQGAVVVPGENFKCPYCRTVSDIGDVLSVSVSPNLLGDPILGDGEQSRFAPTNFTDNGLALDSEGGVCTDIACPCCHMSIPQDLMQLEQIVMSVVGTAGAGKSVLLASSIWQCRQLLKLKFGIGFRDLAPSWNTWIRAYEEKLFFQQDGTKLQQIAKTDLRASSISRSVNLGGESVLLPTPSYFRLDGGTSSGGERCFVVYDCAGEHFLPGADVHSSLVTLHTLSADSVLFLFDPSADPRMGSLLDRGDGTASNCVQMQDVLLAELAAKSKKYMGNRGGRKLRQPLLFAISKADMLRTVLPMDIDVYCVNDAGRLALDVAALREVSDRTKTFLERYAPEVSATAQDISNDIWFFPVSALGHNPMREGVRPCDIKPIWAELPIAFTLAQKGIIPTVNGTLN